MARSMRDMLLSQRSGETETAVMDQPLAMLRRPPKYHTTTMIEKVSRGAHP